MKLRTLIFWPHLICGTTAGLVILLMCVTGALLTYERQMVAWSDSRFRSARPAAGANRLDIETLLDRVRQEQPDLALTAVTLAAVPDAPVILSVPQRTLYVDAYTGRLLGEGSQTVRKAMSEIRAWHRWIAVEGEGRTVARAITGWSNFVFAFIVLSGMYLWIPRTWSWQQIKAVVLFRSKLRGKARDFNWHNVIGVWSAVPLFIVVVSAVPISFQWGNALVYRVVGEEPPAGRGERAAGPRAGGQGEREAGRVRPSGAGRSANEARAEGRQDGAGREDSQTPSREGGGDRGRRGRDGQPASHAPLAGLNDLWDRAERQVADWRTINVRIPASPEAPVVFAIDRGDGGQPHLRSTLTLNSRGDVESYEAFPDLTLGRRIRNVMRFAHTGEVLGLPGQTVAGLVSAGGAVLVWTGLALAWRRLRAWIKRRRPEEVEQVEARSSAA